jgi:serine protease
LLRLLPGLLALLWVPAHAAPRESPRTGRYIIKLHERPNPPRLLQIQEQLTGQYRKGGRRSPYVLVQPHSTKRFILPAAMKPLVDYIEPEIVMWAEAQATGRAVRLLNLKPRIGAPASGSRDVVPQAEQIPAEPRVPNDPHWSYQWGLFDTGFGVRVPSARRYSLGAGVTVGIVDSGVRPDLPDLKGVSFLPPYDAIAARPGGTDANGHGSHIAGTIAQATDNRLGCAGIAPQARLLAVRALGADGKGTNFSIGAGIRYAVDQGCQVVNLSIGGSGSRTLKDACQYAVSKGVLLLAAAGNSGAAQITYPAAYPETLAVGAIDASGKRCGFSQYGKGIGIVAPGEDILQQTFQKKTGQPGYYYYSGTSMATPMVTGVAALVKSIKPSLSLAELRSTLTQTATDLGARGYDTEYGAGLVNAQAACERAQGGPASPAPPPPVIPAPPQPSPKPPPQPAPPAADRLPEQVLERFNRERVQRGLNAVAIEGRLTSAAGGHAAEMAARGVMSHTGADGSNPGQRISRAGYPWRRWGEIVAMGQPTPEAVVTAWMNSSGHRAIILTPELTEVGIAKSGAYWCCCWGTR